MEFWNLRTAQPTAASALGRRKVFPANASSKPGMVCYTESMTDIGSYGVPERTSQNSLGELPVEFESSRIHVSALNVGYYSEDFSHFLSKISLSAWLKENGVPALFGADMQALAKKIREKRSMLGKVSR